MSNVRAASHLGDRIDYSAAVRQLAARSCSGQRLSDIYGPTPANNVEEKNRCLRVEYLDSDARVEVEPFIEQPGKVIFK